MKGIIVLLLGAGLACGAAAALTPSPFAVWLGAMALLCGAGGLLLLQRTVFGPVEALEQALRTGMLTSEMASGYGVLANLADACLISEKKLRQEETARQQGMEELARASSALHDRYELLSTSLTMARDSMRIQARNIHAISLEMHGEIDRLAGQTAPNSTDRLKSLLSECMKGFKSEVDFLDACLSQMDSLTADDNVPSMKQTPQNQEQPFVSWSDSLSTGEETVDSQHKLLLTYINKLHHAINSGRSDKELQEVLDALAGYAFTHFNTEEIIFSATDYPDREKHIQIHEDFKAKVASFQEALATGSANVDMEVLHFLREWLVHHIQGMDVAFGPWLTQKKN
ncbi:MAG: hemerythrin family protein [Desulfovibrio sp.]|nr:hemerythrin family protein [Desulfovibrio sp.]